MELERAGGRHLDPNLWVGVFLELDIAPMGPGVDRIRRLRTMAGEQIEVVTTDSGVVGSLGPSRMRNHNGSRVCFHSDDRASCQ